MTRSFELVIVPSKKSRLTVTPNRVTVKVSWDKRDLADGLYILGQRIAERIDLDVAMRGVFDFKTRSITLSTNRHSNAHTEMTFNFDEVV